MSTYTCYFDASCKVEKSKSICAFYVEHDNRTIYKEVKEIQTEKDSSHYAESTALSNLLKYIWDYIEPKSHVTIYGDAKGVIDPIIKGCNPKYMDMIEKFKYLHNYYELELCFIPRERNYKADLLTKLRSTDDLDLDAIHLDDKDYSFRYEEIEIRRIIVPKRIKYSKPNEDKYQDRLSYFNNKGQFKTPIKIDQDYTLFDGFISYLILNSLGIDIYHAEIYHKNKYCLA